MKDLTVKQLAEISGVTVRTLHHYDEIGLLRPAHVGENGYRHYGRSELLRLQRILFHRELGVALAEIPALLQLEGEDQISVLIAHREKLVSERQRFETLIDTVDRTIADIRGETTMSNADLYKGFSQEKQDSYEAWLTSRYGETMRQSIDESKRALAQRSEQERQALMNELQPIEEALAEGLRRGVEPSSEVIDGLIARHRAWVAQMWGRPCTPEAYAGLADLYLSHPDFVKRYETIAPGFADYLTTAMKTHAARHGRASQP